MTAVASGSPRGITSYRPAVTGRRHTISAGHYLAAHAGFQILEAGGNAIDAGVAAGIAIGVLQSDLVNVAGVAPIILYHAESRQVLTVSGLGWWPKAVTPDFFQRGYNGAIPHGVLRSVVPAAPDAWIQCLQRWGTMTFGDVAAAAIRFAREGFAAHPLLCEVIADHAAEYARWPSNAAIYLPGGKPPKTGDLFVQEDLGRTLQYMADQEKASASKGRVAALEAARAAFYTGDIARAVTAYHEQNGGLMRMSDLAEYRSGVEPAVATPFGEWTMHTCGAWCQGPVLGQMLRLVEAAKITAHPHNSFEYVHGLTEVMKLAFSDRHSYYGDPRFIDVPLARLLSVDYAAERAGAIRPDRASPGMPPPGLGAASMEPRRAGPTTSHLDTSYLCVVDSKGNVFSATPSDVSNSTPVIPGTGICVSSRGSQSWGTPGLPSSVAPGKRPRLTPSPALAIGRDGTMLPLGTPGGDVQAQAMLQTFLNRAAYGMDPQQAIEAPRFATMSFPDSFEPHAYNPGRLMLEGRLSKDLGARLAAAGHEVQWWPEWTWKAGGICMIDASPATGMKRAGADPRRSSYALGW